MPAELLYLWDFWTEMSESSRRGKRERLDRCAGMRYNENSHSNPSQAICGGFVCTGIRCREQLDTGHSGQRGKNAKGFTAVESYSVLEAARQLGRSKNTVKYQLRKLPPECVSKDENGRLWINPDGLELLRERLAAQPDEKPDEKPVEPPKTGRKPDENHLEPVENRLNSSSQLDEEPPTTTQEPPTTGRKTTPAEQLDALREKLDSLRDDLSAAQQAAAVATAERDAERRRADAAELREREQARNVAALTAALQTAQQQAADLTAALTAAQALHAGTIQERLAMQDGEPAATAAAAPAPDLTAAQTGEPPADDQSTEKKRRGLFARLFRKG